VGPNIIFISGIHGVGKTTLCEFLSTELSISHYSASDLISKYAQIELPKSKHVSNISGNQDTLIKAINKFLSVSIDYILDGHFCLLDKEGNITKIPFSTYEEMKPTAIVCLYEDADIVYERLKSRDSHKHNRELLDAFQIAEISYSQEVAKNLGVPYFLGKSGEDREGIRDFLIATAKGTNL